MKVKFTFLLLFIATVAFAQKRVSILGDSYSTYQGYITPATNEPWYWDPWIDERTDVNDVKQTWWWQVVENGGYKLETNNSYSGSTISYSGYRGEDYSARSFITRATNLGSPDIILVFGGTNDSWANSPIGEMKYEGWTKDDFYSYRPAVCYLGQYLYNRYPNTEIYFILNTDLKPEIGAAMQEVCERFGFSLIVLQDISRTQGHPNIEGMKSIADQVSRALHAPKAPCGKKCQQGEKKCHHGDMPCKPQCKGEGQCKEAGAFHKCLGKDGGECKKDCKHEGHKCQAEGKCHKMEGKCHDCKKMAVCKGEEKKS